MSYFVVHPKMYAKLLAWHEQFEQELLHFQELTALTWAYWEGLLDEPLDTSPYPQHEG